MTSEPASAGRDRPVRRVLVRIAEAEWREVDPEGLSFENGNTPDDWARLEALVSPLEPRA